MKSNESEITKINILVGRRILKKRKELGYTGMEFAKMLGVSQQQVSRYECGKNKIDLLRLLRISILFKTSIDWFLQDIIQQYTDHDRPINKITADNDRRYKIEASLIL